MRLETLYLLMRGADCAEEGNMSTWRSEVFRTFFPWACIAVQLSAQGSTTQAEIHGRVQTRDGQVAGAVLQLVNPDTGERRTARSDGEGRYGFRMVPPGTYAMVVQAPGQITWKLRKLEVPMASALVVDVDMKAESGASVVVEAEIASLDPERTQASQVLGQTLIEALPVDRRSFADLSLTVPGVRASNMPTTGGAPTSGLSFQGMNARQNRFLLDGLDNTEGGTGAMRASISQDAIQEFQVITGGYSAELGRAAGGIVNAVLKGGTNTLKGSAFVFDRPGQWDARNPDGSTARDFRQSQMGFTLGGPIVKDRLFYFASLERYRKSDQNPVSIAPEALATVRGAGFEVVDGRQPFEEDQTTALLKLDWNPGANQRWSFRLIHDQSSSENQIPWGGLVARSAGGALDARGTTLSLTQQWLGSEAWVNEVRVLYSRRQNAYRSMDPSGGVSVGIAGTATFGTQRLTPQDTDARTFQFVDVATLAAGSHTLKVGLDVLRSRSEGTVEQNTAGLYQFVAIPSIRLATPLASFAAGLPAAFIQSWGEARTRFSAGSDAVFLQDDWQIHPRLMLKFGLRLEHESLPIFEDASAYQALQHSPAGQDPVYGPVRLPDGEHAYSQLFQVHRDWDRTRLAPRFAFSWSAAEGVRAYGGWGVFSGSTQLGPLFGARLFNDSRTKTMIRTLLDGAANSPYLSWTGLDPTSRNRRYDGAPANYQPTIVIPGEYGMPSIHAWNLGWEWTPAPGHCFTLDLTGSRGTGFMNVRDVNAYVPYDIPALGVQIQRRPDMRFGSVQRIDGSGESRYFGQTIAWRWQSRDDLMLNASYTHGKAEDNYIDWTPDFQGQNSFDPTQEWGPSCEQQTHQALVSAVWRSVSSQTLLKDWTASVIARYGSGRPYSRLAGFDRNMDGDGTTDRPEGVGRNRECLPATHTVDVRLARGFQVGSARFQATFDVFNLFNRANVLQVQNNLASTAPAYGTPLRFGSMRQLQFGLKADF